MHGDRSESPPYYFTYEVVELIFALGMFLIKTNIVSMIAFLADDQDG